jgi:hypothetical protein
MNYCGINQAVFVYLLLIYSCHEEASVNFSGQSSSGQHAAIWATFSVVIWSTIGKAFWAAERAAFRAII